MSRREKTATLDTITATVRSGRLPRRDRLDLLFMARLCRVREDIGSWEVQATDALIRVEITA